jgi:hypothetical protein
MTGLERVRLSTNCKDYEKEFYLSVMVLCVIFAVVVFSVDVKLV